MSYKQEYFVENIKINNINKTISNYILEHKKKFIRFIFKCRIDSVIDKFNKNNKVNLYITFYSEKEDVTHNYYSKCPKPMTEYQMLKILDANPQSTAYEITRSLFRNHSNSRSYCFQIMGL